MMCAYGTDRQPRGAALVIVMLVMAVLLLAGTTFMTISSTESQIALNERASIQASLLAQAAIHRAIATLDTASLSDGTVLTGSQGDSTFTATVTAASTQSCPGNTAKDLFLTASVPVRGGQAQVQLRATADRISYPFRWGAFAVTDYLFLSSLWTKQTLTDSFDSSVGPYSAPGKQGGNVGGNGGLYLWYVDVKGNARSAGWINATGDSTASPPPVPNAPKEVFPDVVPPPTPPPPSTPPPAVVPPPSPHTFNPGTYHFDTINVSGQFATSTTSQDPITIYVTGSLNLGNNLTFTTAQGPVAIYVAGPVTMGNNVTFTAGQGPVTIYATGPVTIGDYFTFTAGQGPVTIYATGQLTLGNNVTFTAGQGPVTIYATGSVPASNPPLVTLGNNVTFNTAQTRVTIYVTVTGPVPANYNMMTLGDNVTLGSHPATNLTIITKSSGGDADQASLIAGNTFRLFGSLYGKNTNIILGDSAEIYGSLIGRKITRGTPAGEFQGSWWEFPPKFHFDQAMYDKAICLNTSSGKYSIRRGTWREVIP